MDTELGPAADAELGPHDGGRRQFQGTTALPDVVVEEEEEEEKVKFKQTFSFKLM